MDVQKQMEIEWQCRKLCAALSYCMDFRLYEDAVALFTEDGIFDRIGHYSSGRTELLAALRARGTNITTRHFATSFHFTHIDETTAKAIGYNKSFVGVGGDDATLPVNYAFAGPSFIEFHDIYANTPEGWRIKERIAKLIIVPKDFPIQSGQNAATLDAAHGQR